MTAVTLRRIDPERNMLRFYRLDVQPDLFGASCLVREWGRIGRPGRLSSTPYATPADAAAALQRQQRAKERRGYSGKRMQAVLKLSIAEEFLPCRTFTRTLTV